MHRPRLSLSRICLPFALGHRLHHSRFKIAGCVTTTDILPFPPPSLNHIPHTPSKWKHLINVYTYISLHVCTTSDTTLLSLPFLSPRYRSPHPMLIRNLDSMTMTFAPLSTLVPPNRVVSGFSTEPLQIILMSRGAMPVKRPTFSFRYRYRGDCIYRYI